LLVRARRFNAALVHSDDVPFAVLAKREGVSPSYFTRVVRPPQLSRPGHHPSDPGRAPAARSDGRNADRALTSAARLARSADRAWFCLSPIRTQKPPVSLSRPHHRRGTGI
jgi:hypothetical protein